MTHADAGREYARGLVHGGRIIVAAVLLAYVFWHGPPEDLPAERYEAALAAFHDALAGNPPSGFQGSAAFRVEGSLGPGSYEDWYLVESWAALGELNEGAVTAPRRGPHDAVAEMSDEGAGGLYRLVRGKPNLSSARSAVWLDKPRGEAYSDFIERIAPLAEEGGGGIWVRQLVLGPAPEFCVLAPEAPEATHDGVALALSPVGRA